MNAVRRLGRLTFGLGSALGLAVVLVSLVASPTSAATTGTWTSYGHDANRSGQDRDQPAFTGVVQDWVAETDGDTYAEPLVYNGRVYVATEENTVFAFDATTGAPVWTQKVGAPAASSVVPQGCANASPHIGVTSTPVIDQATNRLYVVAQEDAPLRYELYTLDLNNGGAVLSHAAIDPWPGTQQQKSAQNSIQIQRGALLLANGYVYITFGGRAECIDGFLNNLPNFDGWMTAMPIAGQAGGQRSIQFPRPSGRGAGLWAPAGATLGPNNDVYVATGNSFQQTTFDWGESVVKLSPTLDLLDYWAPTGWAVMNANDADIGSFTPVHLDNGLIFQSGKTGFGYLIRDASMGGVSAPAYTSPQPICGTALPSSYNTGVWASPLLYVSCTDGIKALRVDTAAPSFTKVWDGPTAGYPGSPILAGGAIWYTDAPSHNFYALNPATGAIRFQATLPTVPQHFATPASGNGRIYAASYTKLTAFRLTGVATPPTSTPTPVPPAPTPVTPPTATPATVAAIAAGLTPLPPTPTGSAPGPAPAPTSPPPARDSGAGGGGGGAGSGGGGGGAGGGRSRPAPTPVLEANVEVAGVQQTRVSPPTPTSAPTAAPTPVRPAAPTAAIDAGGRVAGDTLQFKLSTSAAEIQVASLGLSLSIPDADRSDAHPATAQLLPVAVDSLPVPPENGFQWAGASLQLNVLDPDSGQAIQDLTAPVTITHQLEAAELSAAGGDLTRLTWIVWNGSHWLALPCRAEASTASLSCTTPHPGLLSEVVVPLPSGAPDFDIDNGHFFKQANGYSGAGSSGFAVVDDSEAAFWTEFQRLGGLEQVGYPIGSRFQYRGFLTQPFQKLVLQWRPELGQAVPLNVLDELNRPGLDTWLESERKVPRAESTDADTSLSIEEVQARHVQLLDPYPELATFWADHPDAVEVYGLPLGVKDYGAFVAVRLQRATLQFWRDPPLGPAVLVGSGGDLAKETGLWPLAALATEPAPTARAQTER